MEKQNPAVNTNTRHSTEIAGAAPRVSRAWLVGAYAFLTLWGAAYLVLFFTDRLPF